MEDKKLLWKIDGKVIGESVPCEVPYQYQELEERIISYCLLSINDVFKKELKTYLSSDTQFKGADLLFPFFDGTCHSFVKYNFNLKKWEYIEYEMGIGEPSLITISGAGYFHKTEKSRINILDNLDFNPPKPD